MTDDQKIVIKNLLSRVNYFADHSKDNILFAQEFAISREIQDMISRPTDLSKTDLEKIMNVFNKIEDEDHYNGSGWQDYKLALGHLFRTYGFELKWDTSSKKIDTFRPLNQHT
jgi:hypothetical protein